MDSDDFANEASAPETKPDRYVVSARERLRDFFEKNATRVFFGNQLAVQNEEDFFHWVTHRAIAELIEEEVLKTEFRELAFGGLIKLVWNSSHRYYKRDAKKVVALVEEYGNPNIGGAIGLHGEQMVLGGFARRQFVMTGHNARRHRDREWTKTEHNLDFIFEREGIAYGVEVKNTLSYMERAEFEIKIELCEHLGLVPVFAVRMLPRTWTTELINRGGYAMIMKYQLYPWTHAQLAKRVADELGLPVDAPKWLADGTMERFMNWCRRKL